MATRRFTRRDALRAAATTAAGVLLPATGVAAHHKTGHTRGPKRTEQGVAHARTVDDMVRARDITVVISPTAGGGDGQGSVTWSIVGAPAPNSAQVKARVSGDTTSAVLKVSTSTDLSNPTYTSTGQTPDSVGFVTFNATGLSADVDYHYGVECGGQTSDAAKRGTFKTLPTPGTQYSFTFAHSNCQGAYQASGAGSGFNRPVYDQLANQVNPLFFLFLGDFDYQDVNSSDPQPYRDAYDNQWQSATMQLCARSLWWVSGWDDHDFLGNGIQGETDATSQANRHVRSAEWKRFFPHPTVLPDTDATGGIYWSFVVGRVRVIKTDERYYAHDVSFPNADPAKSMLGVAQEAWLLNEFEQPEPLKVWAHGKPWKKSSLGGDDWGAYQLERTAIMDHWQANGVGSLVHLMGDMHGLAATNTVPPYTTDGLGDNQVLFCGGALRQSGSSKGGPYDWSDATRTLSVQEDQGRNHYGLFTVTDNGDTIDIAWEGRETGDGSNDELADQHIVTVPTDHATNGPLTKSYPAAAAWPPASAVWHADYDDGTTTQMTDGPSGFFHSGTGAEAVVASPTHRGTPFALELSITSHASVENGARAHRVASELLTHLGNGNTQTGTGNGLYASSWVYFPRVYTVNEWMMLSQWKGNYKASDAPGTEISNDPIWALEMDNRAGGEMYPFMRFHGEYTGDSITRFNQSTLNITPGQWHHFEWFTIWSSMTAADGHVTFWMDGTQLFDFPNVKTHQPLTGTEVAVPHFGWTVYGLDIVQAAEPTNRLIEVVYDDMVSSTAAVWGA